MVLIEELDAAGDVAPAEGSDQDAESSATGRGPMSLPELCAQDVMQKMLENPATRARMNDPAFVDFAGSIQARKNNTRDAL